MKKLAFVIVVACSCMFACSGNKKSETKDDAGTSAKADTIVVDYGTVSVDSIAPDSVQVSVADTAVEVVATPEGTQKKKVNDSEISTKRPQGKDETISERGVSEN